MSLAYGYTYQLKARLTYTLSGTQYMCDICHVFYNNGTQMAVTLPTYQVAGSSYSDASVYLNIFSGLLTAQLMISGTPTVMSTTGAVLLTTI